MRKIIGQIWTNRLTLVWSAMLPKDIRNLANDLLADMIQVNIGYLELPASEKRKLLPDHCRDRGRGGIIGTMSFVGNSREADPEETSRCSPGSSSRIISNTRQGTMVPLSTSSAILTPPSYPNLQPSPRRDTGRGVF